MPLLRRWGEPGQRQAKGGPSSRGCILGRALTEPRRLRNEVILFGYARRATGGKPVVCDCGPRVASHFQQVGANGVEAMMACNSWVGVEGF